jgi:hypothetical protein
MSGIFDDFQRNNAKPASETESSYHFLNRVARPEWQRVRDLVEEWYAVYPQAAQADIRGRLQNDDYAQHIGAWWELYIFNLFRRLGYGVSVHPVLANTPRQPDFVVTQGAESMYVECAVFLSTLGAVDGAGGKERSWIFEATNQARDPNFMVDIEIRQGGTQRPKASEIVRPLEEWLASLDPDEVLEQSAAGMGVPQLVLADVRGWTIEYGAWPLKPESRGQEGRLIGLYPSVGGITSNEMFRYREIVRRKGGHYGQPDKPLVVAVLNTSGFLDPNEIAEALFGTHEVEYYQGQRGSMKSVRKRDGYWRQGPPRRGSRVSAVLDGENIYPWRVVEHLPKFWTNPWADLPVTHPVPLQTYTASDAGEVYESQIERGTSAKLFGLTPGWPGFTL